MKRALVPTFGRAVHMWSAHVAPLGQLLPKYLTTLELHIPGMAIRLPIGMRTSGPRTGKEANPLLNDKTETAGKPEIDIVMEKNGALVTVCGRIDMDSSPVLRDRLLAFLQGQYSKEVIIDLLAVTHIDSSGVATLIEALRAARSHKTELRLHGLHGRLLRLFELTGLLPLFNGSL